MRDLFEGNPNLANKRVTVPVTVIPQENLLNTLRSERERLFSRIKPKQVGVVELRLRLKDITRLIMQLELIERGHARHFSEVVS